MWRDIGLLYRMELLPSLRTPAWIAIGLTQPALYLLLFGPLTERIAATIPGYPPGGAWVVFTPALIVQLALFSSSFTGFGLLADLEGGVLERLRTTPASRIALLLGKVLTNATHTLVQAVLIILLAVLVFDLRAPFAGVLLVLAVAALLAVTLSSVSQALALRLRDEDAFLGLLNTVLLPLLLLSGILIPITSGLAPDWLVTASSVNPLTHVVDTGRAGFRGDFALAETATGGLLLLGLAAAALWWGTRTFHRENV
ncbi:ABC transporter permease [Actinophytocola oryzae]|uniref:Transport permease protein n=1 Tax=Actinophytocola oryzae TaxID=502181 RepID=A0A4R7VFE2_9PSEU|nr:ABC transporter permease [Actinophytocola oryzae]TDV47963.1 ABC-2 type transport system permease protein [Actinophytocola oryzae]